MEPEVYPCYSEMTNADVFALTRLRRVQACAERRAVLFGKYGPTQYGKRAVATFIAQREAERPAKSSRAIYRGERRAARERRVALLMRAQSGLCYLCAGEFGAGCSPTLEHVMPQSGGGRGYGNLLLACGPCNNRKADRMPTARESAILRLVNVALARMG